MLYDPTNPLSAQSARLRFDKLMQGTEPFELRKKAIKRTLNQNSYLHLIIAYFASQTGNTLEYVKRTYYKTAVNPHLFIVEKEDKILHKPVKTLRSSSDLTTEEMSESIERFKNWSASRAEIVLPDAENERELIAAQLEVERYKNYL